MVKKISYVQVGCGDIAHVRYFSTLDDVKDVLELVGIWDIDAKVRKGVSAELNVPAYSSWEAVLDDADVDAVIITTYHPSHKKLAIDAIRAGKHVLLEKPMAVSLEEAREMAEAERQSGKVFMALPNDELLFFVKAKELIHSGLIGDIVSANGVYCHHGPLHAPWFFDYDVAKWGVLADLGVYHISTFTYLFGPVESVCGQTTRMQNHRISDDGVDFYPTVEDNAAVIMKWADGKVATINTSWCAAVHKTLTMIDITIWGTKGAIYIDLMNPGHELVVYASCNQAVPGGVPETFRGRKDCYIVKPDSEISYQKSVPLSILLQFTNAIRSGRKIDPQGCSVSRQTHVVELIDKVYKSSEDGKIYDLETKF